MQLETTNIAACNLRFLDANITVTYKGNIAVIEVGYFIENIGLITVTDVFNDGTIQFPEELVISNPTTNNDNITITTSPGKIKYLGNLGSLVPGETTLVTLQFEVVGSSISGDIIVSNISNVVDGQQDDITFAKNVIIKISEVVASVVFKNNMFVFRIQNKNSSSLSVRLDAIINLPPNIEVIFRNFGDFNATFINTNDSVPTNQIIAGGNTILLTASAIRLNPLSAVILPIDFDLYSSSQIGKQSITATISLLKPRGERIVIPELNKRNNTTKAVALLELLRHQY